MSAEQAMPREIAHEAISASAGSGKTFQLSHRYLALLARGVPPERIAAMTFSRKAAREIFSEIMARLAEAAADEDVARQTSEHIGVNLPAAGFMGLLRTVLERLPRLRIGTLDSFMVGIMRAFPMELGMPPAFEVMDEDGAEAARLRNDVLAAILGGGAGRPEAREFLEAFKEATFGQETRGMTDQVDRFVRDNRSLLQQQPEAEAWGSAQRIWPDGHPWLEEPRRPPPDRELVLAALDEAGEDIQNLRPKFTEVIDYCLGYDERSVWDGRLTGKVVFSRLLEQWRNLAAGRGELAYGRNTIIHLPPRPSKLLSRLLARVAGVELRRTLRRTAGIYQVLASFEKNYQRLARQRGCVTFGDVQYMLSFAGLRSGPGRPDDTQRLYIDYRLDGRIDHWLLDEFQDTSDLQWEVLHNLIDEVLQDAEGRRSFFYVGDVKQAIYAWRGGNPRLFNNVIDRYGEVIRRRPLSTSFRSCRPVIDVVNKVFDPQAIKQDMENFSGAGCRRWERVWQEHSCSDALAARPGCVQLLEPPCAETKPTAADRYRLTADLLQELNPLSRGWSCAVLVRRNVVAAELVDTLRRRSDIPVIHEGRTTLLDCPAVTALYSLLRFAAHPADTLAGEHVAMTPLAALLPPDTADWPEAVLRDVQESGYEWFVRHWTDLMERNEILDDFSRRRLSALAAAAAGFDRGTGGTVDVFLGFLDCYNTREGGEHAAVRVMTVHQSKGLGFDMVILPDLNDGSIDAKSGPEWLAGESWILKTPYRQLAEQDEVLAEKLRQEDTDSIFESLCVLYVAMTRAKRGLYMVTSAPGKTSRALTPAAWIKRRLEIEGNGEESPATGAPAGCNLLFSRGSPGWHTATNSVPPPDVPPAQISWPEDYLRQLTAARGQRIEPSALERRPRPAPELFKPEHRKVLDFGSAIHELFERVSWLEDCDPEEIINTWQAESGDFADVKKDACEQFRRVLQTPQFRQALSRPEKALDLWRERSFEIVLNGRWISGVFDRVVLYGGKKCEGATIMDYKSNRVRDAGKLDELVEHYRPQLETYREALCAITGLAPDTVTLQLAFTVPGRMITLQG